MCAVNYVVDQSYQRPIGQLHSGREDMHTSMQQKISHNSHPPKPPIYNVKT